ncbi:MAG: polynucleotide adenylyltransferase PcnB [Gammaproteobacteria bacterium HGW-Gammaproteobacteria-4]|jgi:poly(A) polymerase|nr:MAG: polynucleotide adenylyltransferase PcnB [Gammaproteobacteria bacterium HGW-Gammaproteobacteria-4]
MSSSAISPISLQPVHVARDQHPISRKDISPNALRVLYRLREGGYASYLVGGAVRDLLTGGHPKDYDVATDATPEQVKQLFRNCRLIGRRFRLAHVVYGREIIEVATFRANTDDGTGDRELEDGRLVRDNVYGTIEDDAVRRDFTANALYYTVEDFSVRDYVGGFADVQNRVLRLIGDPETRYREDPVRMLRAIRLAAKLGFSIAPSAAEPIPRLASLLDGAASARLFDECLKMFLTGHAERSFLGLEAHGLLSALFPQATQALARAGEPTRAMVLAALENTDRRVAEQRPVTPAFLLAALLWPAYTEELQALLAQGLDPAVAQQRAADRVILHQAQRVALPRRFSLAMEEIWLLQARFGQRQRKRVFRLLAHPRFRAAFDFLELRAIQDPELLPEVEFWREAQIVPAEQLAEKLAPVRKGRKAAADEPDAPLVGDGATLPPARKRRRRRRPHPAGSSEA